MNHVPAEPISQPPLHIITLGACLDAKAEHLLEFAVYQAQEAQGRHILLNLHALTVLDSRGLGKLFLTYHHLNRQNIRLSMVSPRPLVREMLEFVNLPKLVPLYNTIDEIVGHEQEVIETSGFESLALNEKVLS